MLYILFGRDHIGKKEVRNFIASNYHITIIPKYTNDEHKNWVVYDYDNHYTSTQRYKLPEELDKLKSDRKTYQSKYNCESWVCDENDHYLKYLFVNPTEVSSEGYTYVIEKIYDNGVYKATYFIKQKDIEKALKEKNRDYLLVCTSGKIIDIIRKMDSNEKGVNVKVVLIEGDTLLGSNKPAWNTSSESEHLDSPAHYILKHSQHFLGAIRNNHYHDANGNLEREKFDKNISCQWECLTHMLPLRPNLFMVRPYRSKYSNENYNINDLVEKAFMNIVTDRDKNGLINIINLKKSEKTSIASIFDAMDNALQNAHIILVDLREHKLNCYYEYGFAMGLMKSRIKNVRVYCFLGIENSTNSGNDSQEEMLKELLEELAEEENAKPFDATPFSHSKYICTVRKNLNDKYVAQIQFISQTTADCNYKQELETLITDLNSRVENDLYELVKVD